MSVTRSSTNLSYLVDLAESPESKLRVVARVFGLIIGAVLAVGNLLCWNPEHWGNEEGLRTMWRLASVLLLVAVLLLAVWTMIEEFDENENQLKGWVVGFVASAARFLYPYARSSLTFVIIQSLYRLPDGVHDDVDWLHYIPFFH